jgi:anti-anti-sigma factor
MPETSLSDKTTARYTMQLEPILVVDDDRLVLLALEETLKRDGYDVLTAKNGQEAIAILKEHPISLILCDQRMPGMTGVEVLAKAQELAPYAMRLMLTGNVDLESAMNAINIGQVSQYITKPWNEADLRKNIQTAIDTFRLLKENRKLQEVILEQNKELTKNHLNFQHELRLGARIHQTLLLGKVPEKKSELTIKAISIPSKDIDGDFFEFYQPSSQVMDIVVGDVMGKGLPAALVGTAVKTQLMRFAMPAIHAQIYEKKGMWLEDLLNPKEILKQVHAAMVPQLIYLEYFACLFYARFHMGRKTLQYIDCGSPKPFHYQASTKKISQLKGDGLPLGTIDIENYEINEVRYEPNDIFVFYSDGVTEARSPEGEFFGDDKLETLIKNHSDLTADELIGLIRNTVIEFTHMGDLHDDFTLVVVKVNNELSLPENETVTAKFSSHLSQLQAVRDFIHRVCQKTGKANELYTQKLQLAINEIFCNITIHGYKSDPFGTITIRAEILDDGIALEIFDSGTTFDPASIEEPSLAGDEDNGFGWFLIKEIVDRITYVRKKDGDGQNHLHVFKQFSDGEKFMELDHETLQDVLVITPHTATLDAKDAPDFKEKVINLISKESSNNVVLDLHQLTFIDSSGLGSFLSVLRTLHTQGGELKLARMNKPIRTMFELVSMHKIFEIFNSTEDAIRSFKKR